MPAESHSITKNPLVHVRLCRVLAHLAGSVALDVQYSLDAARINTKDEARGSFLFDYLSNAFESLAAVIQITQVTLHDLPSDFVVGSKK